MRWTVHFLQAEGSLDPWRDRLRVEAAAAHDRIEAHLAPDIAMPAIDVLVQRLADRTIPELGVVGHALRRGCMVITLDPDNANFETSLAAGQFTRMLTHEVHHCLRASETGFGTKLADALVTEGLADWFDCEVNGGDGQIWDRALGPEQWAAVLRLAQEAFVIGHYDHDLWFYGPSRGQISLLPRWTGYTLGYHLVGAYLQATTGARPSRMAGIPTNDVLAIGWPILCGRHGVTVSDPR